MPRLLPSSSGAGRTLLSLVAMPVRAEDPGTVGKEVVAALTAEEKDTSGGAPDAEHPGVPRHVQRRRKPLRYPPPALPGRGDDGQRIVHVRAGDVAEGPPHHRHGEAPRHADALRQRRRLMRMLVETRMGAEDLRHALVLRVTDQHTRRRAPGTPGGAVDGGDPVDLCPARRRDPDPGGHRGIERHVLIVEERRRPRIQSWSLIRHLTSPDGQSIDQTYACDVTGGPRPDRSTRIEESVINPPPSGNAAFRITEVKQEEALPSIKPEQLALRFPKGTVVTTPAPIPLVEYEIAEEGLNEADVAAAVGELAKGRVMPGSPAPDFRGEGPEGQDGPAPGFQRAKRCSSSGSPPPPSTPPKPRSCCRRSRGRTRSAGSRFSR